MSGCHPRSVWCESQHPNQRGTRPRRGKTKKVEEQKSRPQQRVLQMPQERQQLPSVPAQVAKPSWLMWAGSACPFWCPVVAMPTPRLCLRMLYLISHVWNSNYVISQHRVAMTARPMFPGWLTPWEKGRGLLAPPQNLNSEAP